MTFIISWTSEQVWVPSIFVRVIPLLEFRILKIHTFPHFSPTCLTYWPGIRYNTFVWWTSDQVRMSSICVNFCRSTAPFGTQNAWKQFSALFSYMLWYIELKFCIWLSICEFKIKFECCPFASIFVGVMPILELGVPEIHSFPHFFPACFEILSWNFIYDFHFMNFRTSLSVINFCRSYTPFVT